MSTRTVQLLPLGLVEYEDGAALQKRLREARLQGLAPDTLILLEHPPVVTLGRGAKKENLRWSAARFQEQGVQVVETERGGDVTYHGPGQLVVYPILDLAPDRKDVRRYVRDLEETLIRTLASFDIIAHREPKWPGVWVGSAEQGDLAKIAALGVHISRWVTLHGLALNVTPRLAHFQSIVPCGIREADVTSMERVLWARGQGVPAMAEVRARLIRAFSEVFDAQLIPAEAPRRTVSVFVTRETEHGPALLLLRRSPARGGFWQPVTGKVDVGEAPEQAAARELWEETGARLPVLTLDYVHTFGFGETLPPSVLEESAWYARWPEGGRPVTLSDEHDLQEWVSLPTALERLPFAGLCEGPAGRSKQPGGSCPDNSPNQGEHMSGIRRPQSNVAEKTLRVQAAAERVGSHLAEVVLMAARSGAERGAQELEVQVPAELYLTVWDPQTRVLVRRAPPDLGETMRKATARLHEKLAQAGIPFAAKAEFDFRPRSQDAFFAITLTAAS